VGHTGAWDAVRAKLHEPDVTLAILLRLAVLVVGGFVASQLLHRKLFTREAGPNVLSRWAVRFGLVRTAQVLGVISILVCHLLSFRATPMLLPNHWGAILYSLYLSATFVTCARLLAWFAFQHVATPERPLLPLYEARFFLAAHLVLWACDPLHAVLETLLGLGIHVVVLHALYGLALVVGTAVGLVVKLAATSPLETQVAASSTATSATSTT
jgi:hypothetical protein